MQTAGASSASKPGQHAVSSSSEEENVYMPTGPPSVSEQSGDDASRGYMGRVPPSEEGSNSHRIAASPTFGSRLPGDPAETPSLSATSPQLTPPPGSQVPGRSDAEVEAVIALAEAS